jgi:2-polyprenyl-6-methoxyphenol hydroxylase-like FAD-dependent oxidoreductase
VLEVPVLIAGGGPVGLTLSLELGRRGIRHLLVSEAPGTTRHPKCNTVNARSMEHFRRLGVAGALRAAGLPPGYPRDILYRTHLTGFDILRAPAPGEEAWSPEPLHRVSQLFLEPVLLEHARASAAADIRYGWRLESFEETENQVLCRILNIGKNEMHVVAARWLAGCDGARSTVRKGLGIRFDGESRVERKVLGGTMLAVYFRSAELGGALADAPAFLYWTADAQGRTLTFAIDGRERFLTHVPLRSDAAPDVSELIARIAGRRVAFEVLSSETWNAGFSLVAERYGSARVFLAGDAAHLFTPTGGFGMNTGIDDVANLAWKIAALEEGWGGAGLASSYDAERRPVGVRNTSAARGIADRIGNLAVPAAIGEASAAGAQAREEMARQVNGTLSAHYNTVGVQLGVRYDASPIVLPDGSAPPADPTDAYTPSARPGSRLPHAVLDDGSALFDRLGAGFSLLHGADERVSATNGRVPLKTIPMQSMQPFDARYVLVRPDQHVAWRGDILPQDIGRLLDAARGAA